MACLATGVPVMTLPGLAATLSVPPGFTIERVAGPEVRFPMFATLDDKGRLYVTESSGQDLYAELLKQVRGCSIRRLEDRDGDGRYETSLIFAEGLEMSDLSERREEVDLAMYPICCQYN